MSENRSGRAETEGGSPNLADPLVFAAHYRDAYRRLTHVAAGVTGDRASAEDLVQDAAIIAYEKRDQFAAGTNFAAWLAEIVRRCALNARRKSKQRRTYAADPAALGTLRTTEDTASPSPLSINHAGDPEPHELASNQDAFDDELTAALEQLSPDARGCLLLRVVERLSYAEISALMNMPEGTAMSHVHRSKATLRRLLAPSPEPDSSR